MIQVRSILRHLRAGWRDTMLLLRDFRAPLFLFILVVIGGGLVYYSLAQQAGEPLDSPAEAVYYVLALVFFQGAGNFPHVWYLQVFFFAMPLVGLSILAQGLTEFGVLLFNRKARSKEWEMAVASTFSNHIILIGLGHLGYRVVTQLHALNQDVVVVELDPRDDLVANLRALDIPIIQGDATRESILEAVGIKNARVLVLCTQNDNLNMQIAVKARTMNPQLLVIMRIFDDDFARALEKQFGFNALSATSMAAPAFAAAAAGMDISNPINVEGEALSVARINITPKSKLAQMNVLQVEEKYRVSIVLLQRDGKRELHPQGTCLLGANDILAILGAPEQIRLVMKENK